MGKSLALLLAAFMFLSLAACRGTEFETTPPPPTATPPPTDTPAPTPDNTTRIDVFWYDFSDSYLTGVRSAMEETLAVMPNINCTMHDCESDQAKQTEKIEASVTRGTDLLVVNIVDTASEEAAMNITELAKNSGLPIIFFNREVSDAVVNSYENACFVGVDPNEAGYRQGQAAAEFLLTDDNLSKYDVDGDKEIKYIVIRGECGASEATPRHRCSLLEAKRLLEDSGYTLTPSPANEKSNLYDTDPRGENPNGFEEDKYFLYGNWQASEAKKLMDTALTTYSLENGDIELILCTNDDQALGAIEALNNRGYNTGAPGAGYIPVFGIDATEAAREAIAACKMTGTVMQGGAALADCILALARNIAGGEDLFANTGGYNVDQTANKIRVPYVIVG